MATFPSSDSPMKTPQTPAELKASNKARRALDDSTRLRYAENASASGYEYMLWELPDALLKEVENGSDLVLKGSKSKPAVLTSSTETFAAQELDTSNLLLLVEEEPIVVSQLHSHFECHRIIPSRAPLIKLISSKPFPAAEEEEAQQEGYRFSELESLVQISPAEIASILDSLHAIEIDGRWYQLNADYEREVFRMLLLTVEEHASKSTGSWFECIPERECVAALANDVPEAVASRVLILHTDACHLPDGRTGRKFNVKKCFQTRVKEVFETMHTSFRSDDLLEILVKELPAEFEEEIRENFDAYMYCIGFKDADMHSYLSVLSLPDKVPERTKVLFDKKDRWPTEELFAYVSDLVSDPTDRSQIEKILMNYTVAIKDDTTGDICYVRKR